MGSTRKSSTSLELQRRQLDARLTQLTRIETPRGGWLRTIRQSIGMTLRQMGKRLGISTPAVSALEAREWKETITVGKLRQAAEALGCDLRIALIPKSSLEALVRQQATLKAKEERNRLIHTMHLEAQEEGVQEVLIERNAVERWLRENNARLWD